MKKPQAQKINIDKSSVFFNPNTSQDIKDEIFNILGPMQDSRHTKYMGLPSFNGRSKTQVFSILKERIGQKLVGWKGKLLLMWGEGNSHQSNGSRDPDVYYELLRTPT